MNLLIFVAFAATVLGVTAVFLATREQRDRARTGAQDPRARDIRKNHALMARWIDRILDDEMIYPVIPSGEQTKGRQLVTEYYDQGATK
jgi:hypothetical protein